MSINTFKKKNLYVRHWNSNQCSLFPKSIAITHWRARLHPGGQTTNILTLCKKMSVGHICNVVLGGLENICTEWVFTCFFTIKQTVSTSCLVCLKLIFIILFYFTYCTIFIWWCSQLCANVGWQNFVGLRLSMGFALCYISGGGILSCLIDFWKIFALVI